MLSLLRFVSWPEWRAHPLRHATALLAVALGVALAFAVHLINASALAEFSSALRQVEGRPDLELRARDRGGFDEALYARVAAAPQVAAASPVIEIDSYAVDARGERAPIRIVGLDVFAAAQLAPEWLPQPAKGTDRSAVIDPSLAFLNPAARRLVGATAQRLRVQSGSALTSFDIAGTVAAGGAPLAVIDIAGVQQRFGWLGRLSRIDVKLVPGADRAAVVAALHLPENVRAAPPDEAAARASDLSRAYRVNLSVLALVALFTGSFLVFSVLALSVAQRLPQLALLGVLGLAARERLRLVLAECALLGLAGSVLGLALGTALASAALRFLSGDLGGGYFPGVAPSLHFAPLAALVHGALGILAALAGGWLPARIAEAIAPAQALKGLGVSRAGPRGARAWSGPLLLAASVPLALLPPIADMPLPAYLAVACLLLGGIACVPAGVAALLGATKAPRHALALLAVERARDQRHQATIAVAGVVASLALAVALTVMVASFRDSVAHWLDTVLPADLYARGTASSAAADSAFLDPAFVAAAAQVQGVARVEPQRLVPLSFDAARPNATLIARPLADPARRLPLVGSLAAPHADLPAIYVSEAMRTLYGAAPGTTLGLPLPGGQRVEAEVRGVWRDYVRQFGAIAIDLDAYRRLTGDVRVNDLALWLAPGADEQRVLAQLRALAGDPPLVEFATTSEIRRASLALFDRSFAVTYWLQAVAIGIGLVGIAASFSAQVLARRKEFGLLAHLGLSRRDILTVVAAEGAVWTAAGALLGLALGLAVAVVLVEVVNPQSFRWTMDLSLPWARLALLAAAVLAAGTITAWLAGRKAASRDLALAVREDW
jgi:putative ABC transport system permease protein